MLFPSMSIKMLLIWRNSIWATIYTTASVAYRWAWAVTENRSRFGVFALRDGTTNRPTDGPTDIASYRVACTRLKTQNNKKTKTKNTIKKKQPRTNWYAYQTLSKLIQRQKTFQGDGFLGWTWGVQNSHLSSYYVCRERCPCQQKRVAQQRHWMEWLC